MINYTLDIHDSACVYMHVFIITLRNDIETLNNAWPLVLCMQPMQFGFLETQGHSTANSFAILYR